MKRIILLNGSCHENGNTFIALNEIRRELESRGIEARILWLGQGPVQDCVQCHGCRETGRCAFSNDCVDMILDDMDNIDGIVVGSPVYYAGPSGRLCSILDRLFFAAGGKWAGKIGAAVVCCRRGGATAAFNRLNSFFLMNNMVIPGSQYWNLVYGGAQGDALQDAEGLQTMRTLAANIARLLDNMKDVPLPEYEKHVMTNFIR